MMYIRYLLSSRQVEDLLLERGIGTCHETVRFSWNRFGPQNRRYRRPLVTRGPRSMIDTFKWLIDH